MMDIVIVFALAAAAGMAGAALGVRDLKRKAVITIERGKPRGPFPTEPESGVEALGATPQADFGL